MSVFIRGLVDKEFWVCDLVITATLCDEGVFMAGVGMQISAVLLETVEAALTSIFWKGERERNLSIRRF